MYIVKKIIVKSTISLFVGVASTIGAQVAMTLWSNGLGEKIEGKTKKLFKAEEEFA